MGKAVVGYYASGSTQPGRLGMAPQVSRNFFFFFRLGGSPSPVGMLPARDHDPSFIPFELPNHRASSPALAVYSQDGGGPG